MGAAHRGDVVGACAFRFDPVSHSNLIRSPIPGHPVTPLNRPWFTGKFLVQ